jgi:hypothetical protein
VKTLLGPFGVYKLEDLEFLIRLPKRSGYTKREHYAHDGRSRHDHTFHFLRLREE